MAFVTGKVKKQLGPPPKLSTLPLLMPGTQVRYVYDRPEGAAHVRAWNTRWSDEVVVVERVLSGKNRDGKVIDTPLYYLLDPATGDTIERPYYREELLEVKSLDRKRLTVDTDHTPSSPDEPQLKRLCSGKPYSS